MQGWDTLVRTVWRVRRAWRRFLVFGGVLSGAMAQQCRQSQAQYRQVQAQQQATQRQVMARQIVSASYSGQLTPATDLSQRIRGNTITEQAPIIQNGRVVDTKTVFVYFAKNGTAYTPAGAGPYTVSGGQFCIERSCQPAYYDGTGQLFLMNSQQVAYAVTSIADGDAQGLRAQAAQAEQTARNNRQMAGALLGAVTAAMMSGDSGSNGGGSATPGTDENLQAQRWVEQRMRSEQQQRSEQRY